MITNDRLPFLFGAQYYRAPTPERACWATDLAKMRDLGFTQVKYWVQWRWSHRAAGKFHWDDLDELMDLAGKNGIGVTLNTIFDVAPVWLYERYPDARQVDIKGLTVEPFAIQHRQIGGHPGPCYNHPAARDEREAFLRAAVEHFRKHPAMAMWDIWNEPEQSYPRRAADMSVLTCYCGTCRTKFVGWLKQKYGTIAHLNEVWGRCYDGWEQVETPRTEACVTDFIDWREFHLDTMTAEARWRLGVAKELDKKSVAYLHVVPNTMTVFNPVTCVDDFDLAAMCDVWAATMNQNPVFTTQVVSAAGPGKVSYNTESHVNFGSLRRHQRVVDLPMLLHDWLPQVGLGVKGFLFWQFRPEVLGTESPAWGMVNLDGSDRPVTHAARTFWKTLAPHAEALMRCPAPQGDVGIYKGRKNELYHFCMDRGFAPLADSVEAYLHNGYWMNYRVRFVSGQMLAAGQLDGIKLLVLPSALYLTREEADQLIAWVNNGGVVLSEAHLGAYDATRGRHDRQVPGMGLAEAFGIRETQSTATQHLKLEQAAGLDERMNPDELKAWKDAGAVGGEYVPVKLRGGGTAWGGGSRYAVLDAPAAEVLGSFDGTAPSIVGKAVGKGYVFYAGVNLGQGAKRDPAGLRSLLALAAQRAGVKPTLGASEPDVHVDVLEENGKPRFVLIWNRADDGRTLKLDLRGKLRGLFSGARWNCEPGAAVGIPGKTIDLFVVE